MMNSVSEDELICTPVELKQVANDTIRNLLPEKSQDKYISAYNNFMDWCSGKNVKSFTEDVLLAYFNEISDNYKSSTLWTFYSMLRSTLNMNNGINIENYLKLRAFLKRISEEHVAKRAKTFTPKQLNKFITEAPDDNYLATKVALIMGITGACCTVELHHMKITDLEDHGCIFMVCVPNTKPKIARTFTITGNYYTIVKKYLNLRPRNISQPILFFRFQNGKYHSQRIGINRFGDMGKDIAIYLKLPDSNLYTGHCFRRSSTTLLVHAGGDISALNRHGDWRSTTVTEGYVDDSQKHKTDTANKIYNAVMLQPISTSTTYMQQTQKETINLHRPRPFKGSKHNRIYCRLCLKPAYRNSLTPLSVIDFNYPGKSETFRKKKLKKMEEINKMLKFCLPFYDSLTFNPIICSICLGRLKACYEFSKECLKSQRLIEKFADTYGATERVINLNEMIKSRFALSEDEKLSDIETEVLDIPKVTSRDKISQKRQCSSEDRPPAKKRKGYLESHEEDSQTSSNDDTNIKIEPDDDHSYVSTDALKMEPNEDDALTEHDVPQNYRTDPNNINEETMIKVEPNYIDCPDFIKNEPPDDLHVKNEVFPARTSVETDIEKQPSHFSGTKNVSLVTTNVPPLAIRPVFPNVGSSLEDTTSDVIK